MRAPFARRFSSESGFKMAELMVAVGIFVLGGGVAYPLLVGDVALYARNFSLNKSDNSLRYSLQKLKTDIDMSIEPPTLMNYTLSGSTGVLVPQSNTVVSATGILLWVSLGPSYDLQPTSAAIPAVPVTGTITLNRRVKPTGSTTDPYASSPMPQIGDRLVIMSPQPYAAGMADTVNMNGVSIQKPGRRILAVNGLTSGPVPDNGASSISIQLDPAGTALPTTITGPQSVYVVREVAYAVNTLNDQAGNPVECQLLRYPNTNDMTTVQVLIRDVDPAPKETDTNPGATGVIQPFNYYGTPIAPLKPTDPITYTKGGRGNLSTLSINLPVRAIDYANAITTRQSSLSSEFNVYLRSSPEMGVKVRLD